MQWSWADLMATPAAVVVRLIEQMNETATAGGTPPLPSPEADDLEARARRMLAAQAQVL